MYCASTRPEGHPQQSIGAAGDECDESTHNDDATHYQKNWAVFWVLSLLSTKERSTRTIELIRESNPRSGNGAWTLFSWSGGFLSFCFVLKHIFIVVSKLPSGEIDPDFNFIAIPLFFGECAEYTTPWYLEHDSFVLSESWTGTVTTCRIGTPWRRRRNLRRLSNPNLRWSRSSQRLLHHLNYPPSSWIFVAVGIDEIQPSNSPTWPSTSDPPWERQHHLLQCGKYSSSPNGRRFPSDWRTVC